MKYQQILPLFLVLSLSTQAWGMDSPPGQSWEEERFPLVQEEFQLRLERAEKFSGFKTTMALVSGGAGALFLGLGAGVAYGQGTQKEILPGLALAGVGTLTGMGLLLTDSHYLNRWGYGSIGAGIMALGINATILNDPPMVPGFERTRAREYRIRQNKIQSSFVTSLGTILMVSQALGGQSLQEVHVQINDENDLSVAEKYKLGMNYLRADLTKRRLTLRWYSTCVFLKGLAVLHNAVQFQEDTDTSIGIKAGVFSTLVGATGLISSVLKEDVFLLVDEDKVKAQWSLLPVNGGATLALSGTF